MSTTSLRRVKPFDFPQELIDEIISHNQDDSVFVRAASLVSKPWRAAALRYLFCRASFLCKADFIRWVNICASLPCVAKYVRRVDVQLGSSSALEERAERAPDGFVGKLISAVPETTSASRLFRDYSTVLDCDFPTDSDFELVLPPMNSVTHLHWTTIDKGTGFNVFSTNITHFLESLTRVRRFSFLGNVGLELEHIMSFFSELRRCQFTCGIPETVVEGKLDYAFAGNLSTLEEVWFEDCVYGSMDWLSNRLFSKSLPPLRKIGWEFSPPLSPPGFVRLIQMVASTLEELCCGPMDDRIAPPFALGALLPVLQTVVIRSTEDHDILSRWLHSLLEVFPLCPSLKKFEVTCYLDEPVGVIENTFKHPFMDWTLMLEARYPSLEVVEFELMMEDEADYPFEDREHLETVIKQEVKFGKSKRLVINWCPAR